MHPSTLLRSACLASILLLSACASTAPQSPGSASVKTPPTTTRAGTDNPPRSILYVGNSFMYYNNSLHGHVRSLTAGVPAGERKRTESRGVSVTISGSGLDWHDVGSYFRPDGIGRYSFVGDNEIRINPPGRQFDAVLMMDCSQCPVHPELSVTFFQFARQHSETVRANGAEPMFLMTWAYQDKPDAEIAAHLGEVLWMVGERTKAMEIWREGLALNAENETLLETLKRLRVKL